MRTHYIRLLQYERWANLRITEALEKLETPPEKALSLMGHILNAQVVWFTRVTNDHQVVGIWDLLPVSWLKETADLSYLKWDSFIRDDEVADFDKIVHYQNTKGVHYETSLGDILTHLSHHAAYHRGQIVMLLKPVLNPLPVTDYVQWPRE